MNDLDRNDTAPEPPNTGPAPEGSPAEPGREPEAPRTDTGEPREPEDPSAAEAAPPAADSAAPLETETQASDAQALKDRLLRLQADFENYRKRMQRERTELYRRANEDLVAELLPALDHFEMGLANAAQDDAQRSLVDGFRLIYDQLLGALTKFGLEPLPAAGQPFDPHHHEAVTQLPSPHVPADTVLEELRRGYRFGDRLLRAAQVVVSSGPPPGAEGAGEGADPEPPSPGEQEQN